MRNPRYSLTAVNNTAPQPQSLVTDIINYIISYHLLLLAIVVVINVELGLLLLSIESLALYLEYKVSGFKHASRSHQGIAVIIFQLLLVLFAVYLYSTTCSLYSVHDIVEILLLLTILRFLIPLILVINEMRVIIVNQRL